MKNFLVICAIIGLTLAVSGISEAAMTTVYDTTWNPMVMYPNLPDEWDLVSGLPTYPGAPGPHGGGVAGANDILDYYYSSWTRIDDYGVTHNDQLWLDLNGGALVKAIYTGSSLYLGYSTNENTGSSINWLSGSGGGYLNTVGETSTFDIVPNSDAFVWAIGGAGTKYSRQALNSGGKDYMVSFLIHGILNTPGNPGGGYSVPTYPTYVIGFEDGTDKDFQDFVVQVSNVGLVPEPTTMLLLGIGLIGLAGGRIRKRFKA